MTNPEFHLHPPQGVVYQDKTRYRLVVAGRRFGKTTLAIDELVIEALSHSECKLWYLAPFRSQAKEIAWEMLKVASPEYARAKVNESELYIEYTNGSRVSVKGADNEESLVGVYLGCKNNPGGLGCVIDEVALIRDNRKVWGTVIQPMLSDCSAGVLFIGTPRGKDFFFELYMKGQREEDGFKSWHFTSYDNPYLDPKEIDAKKNTMSEREFNQEYLAKFEDYTGLIWPEFDPEHIIEEHFVQQVYPKIGVIDTAVSGTTGVLKAYIDEDGVIVVYEEYYQSDSRVDEVAEAIKQEGVNWYIDPESHKKQAHRKGQEEFSLFDEYSDHGITAENAQKDVHAGINRTAEFFKTGKIKIFKSCKNLIWELERYHWSEQRETIHGVTEAKPFKKDDHLCLEGRTKVFLSDGSTKRIDCIETGDIVRTPKGKQRVVASQKTGVENIWELKLSSGKILRGTAGHKIYTHRGKVALSRLQMGDRCLVLDMKTGFITGMVDIMQRVVAKLGFMLQFGKSILAKFLVVIVFTMKMRTEETTLLPILGSSTGLRTLRTIPSKDLKTKDIKKGMLCIWRKSENSRKYGILPKRVGCGIANTARRIGLKEKRLTRYAYSVGNILKHILKKLNIVITTVSPHIVESVYETNRKKAVYNITVEDEHCYYANGILVANCDCLRYMVMSRPENADIEFKKPIHPNSPAARLARAKKRRRR